MQHHFHPTILRSYDIRGIVGETLHEASAHAIGFGLGAIVGKRAAAVSLLPDGRLSSTTRRGAKRRADCRRHVCFDIGQARRRCFILPTATLPVMPLFRSQDRITRRHITGSRWCLPYAVLR